MTQLPAYLLKRQSRATTEDMVNGIASSVPAHVSLAANRFTLVDASGNQKPIDTLYLDVCVIGSNNNVSRVFYDPAKKYNDKGDNGPPLCFSDNGTGPSRQASMPQSPTCAVCPNAEWGSAVSQMTGRGIPACQSAKKLACIIPGDADEIIYMLRVPPASLKNLQKYVKTLAGSMLGGRPAEAPDVITRLRFESQGVLKFDAVGLVDEDTFNRTEQVYATDAIAQVTGRDDMAIDPSRQLAAPVQTSALEGPAPQRMAPPAPNLNFSAGATEVGRGEAPTRASLPTQQVIPPAKKALGADDSGIPDFVRNQAPLPDLDQEPVRGEYPPRLQEPAKPTDAKAPAKARKPKAADAPVDTESTTAIPGFLQRTKEAPATANFGMVSDLPPPSNDVNEALALAFKLPGV